MFVCHASPISFERLRHAALYVLEKGATVHWRKTGIEGFFYILKRDSVPRYRLLLRNQADNTEGDFIQSIDDNIKFEVKEDTFFYQYELETNA
jgi:hypothetical protein